MFVWKNGELNPEQESAIFNENSVLLIACPGSCLLYTSPSPRD